MAIPVATVCQKCHGPLTTEYVRLGAPVQCPHCHHLTVPEVPIGGAITTAGYGLTYRDFRQLLEDPQDRAAVAPLIVSWYGFEVVQCGTDTLVRGKDRVPVDMLWLHLDIQADDARRYQLYQTAMSLWR
jgi:hypothetical protein